VECLDAGVETWSSAIVAHATEAFVAYPQASFNQASADWQDTKAGYAFIDNPL
jgi:hypothetical protein